MTPTTIQEKNYKDIKTCSDHRSDTFYATPQRSSNNNNKNTTLKQPIPSSTFDIGPLAFPVNLFIFPLKHAKKGSRRF